MKTHFMVGVLAIAFGVLWNITAQTQEVAQPAAITAPTPP
jgi:hypothetical protein